MNRDEVLSVLRQSGWKVTASPDAEFILPDEISQRYPSVPREILAFLSCLQLCTNPDETAWFLTRSDFEGAGGSAFRWNEFECMSLDAADGDPQWQSDIRSFWDSHFPFMLSVKSGYAYFAVCLTPEKLGTVVSGCEPEFEEASEVSTSFAEFQEVLCQAVQTPEVEGVIQVAL